MEILSHKYFDRYKELLKIDFGIALKEVNEIELNPKSFTFYTSVAVISSSKIEGEQMEVDSYVKHKMQDVEYLSELVEKPNDLFKAYLFARENNLSKVNFLKSHTIISTHLLPEKWRGIYRQKEMVVVEHNTGRIQYEAAPYSIVEAELEKLWKDIATLLVQNLTNEETFYFASYIHLIFAVIHPFNDGNGRAARLLEKWFLAEKLGEISWYIQSEKYYYQNVNDYYKNLNRIGIFYDNLNYSNAEQFLQMLPNAISIKD